jgi:hypothetical protein
MDKLVTIATYDKITDAQIALGRLKAEGIHAVLHDANFVQMDWLYAIALGGIKLKVKASERFASARVLTTDYSNHIQDEWRV